MEKAGHFPILTNAAKAKEVMGKINKTYKLDSRGLATYFHKRWVNKHGARLYFRLRAKKGHGKAVVAAEKRLA